MAASGRGYVLGASYSFCVTGDRVGVYHLFSVDEGVWAGETLGVGPAAQRTWEAIRSTAACRVDGEKAHPPP